MTEFSAQVDPDDDFLTKITFDVVVKRICTFYSGSVFNTLLTLSPSKIKELAKQSKNWMDEQTTEAHGVNELSARDKEIEKLTNTVMLLSDGLKRMEYKSDNGRSPNNNFNRDGAKEKCPICKGSHAGECIFKKEDACKEPQCVNRGMFGARHLRGCKYFTAGKGYYCIYCGKNRIIAYKCSKECQKKAEDAKAQRGEKSEMKLLTEAGETGIDSGMGALQPLWFRDGTAPGDPQPQQIAIEISEGFIGSLGATYQTFLKNPTDTGAKHGYEMFVPSVTRLMVDRGAIVSAAPMEAIIPGTFIKKDSVYDGKPGDDGEPGDWARRDICRKLSEE